MAQLYLSDEIRFNFSSTSGDDGRYRSNSIATGTGRFGITFHDLPDNHFICIEGNNSRPRLPGFEGYNNPVSYAIMNRQQSSLTAAVSGDALFTSNWVKIKPWSEAYYSDSSSANGCLGSDTGIFQIQGMWRFIRLSISAAPLTTGLTASRGYYFDELNIMRG